MNVLTTVAQRRVLEAGGISLAALCLSIGSLGAAAGEPWTRHTIDDTVDGADGVRLADVNGDGLLDVVTGWEESGQVRVCLNPGVGEVTRPWPVVVVGPAPSVEDAVAIDLDGDGQMEVVSACEKGEESIRIHRRADGSPLEESDSWSTQALPASQGIMQWMYVVPGQVDGQHGPDLIAGGKRAGAAIGWFESPETPTELDDWRWHPLADVGWVMSIALHDMNGDGHDDIVYSDRLGEPGVYWLEHPGGTGGDVTKPWPRHVIGLQGLKNPSEDPRSDAIIAFLSFADVDGDGLDDVVVGADRQIAILRKVDAGGLRWETTLIPIPAGFSGAKSVKAGDLTGDGELELAFTTLAARPGQTQGVGMVRGAKGLLDEPWTFTDLGGPAGEKFDLLELIDLDGDGDLDLLTCEETTGLGVVWYENPSGNPSGRKSE